MINLFSALLFLFSISSTLASDSLSYSGRLVNSNGSPVAGPVNLTFELSYSGTPSSPLCTLSMTNVPLTNGVFHAKLAYSNTQCGGTSLSSVLTNTPTNESIAIRVIDNTNTKTYGHQSVHAMPYAIVAQNLSKMGATTGQVLKWNGTKWAPAADGGGGAGTVTEVRSGSGMSPVTINSSNPSGTIGIAAKGVVGTLIGDSAITDIKVSAVAAIARSKLANGTPSSVVINNGAGVMIDTAVLPLTMGGTGANTNAGARTNLGLGTAAVANIGNGVGNVMGADAVPQCLASEKLQMTVGPTYAWTCIADSQLDATKLPLAGGTMSGIINMGGQLIENLGAPAAGTDATTKTYVDTLVGSNSHWTLLSGNVYRATGKVGLGTSTPEAALDISSTTSGILIPRMTTAQRTAITPAVATEGMQVYDTSDDQIWFIKGGTWTALGAAGSGVTSVTTAAGFASPATNATGALTLNIDVGTGINQIVQLDGTAKLPAIDGSQLTNLSHTQVSGIVPTTKGGTGTGSIGTANQVLGVNNAAGGLEYKSIVGGTNVGVVHTANIITLNVAGAAPTGAAGGDLAGTYPNPTVKAGLDATKIGGGGVTTAEFDFLGGVTSDIQTQLNAKEGTVTASDNTKYWDGTKSWVILDTSKVPENGNLYFLDARVRSAVLTGYAAGTNTALAASDTLLVALGKLEAQIAATTSGTTGAFINNGNSFAAPAVLGTNDNNSLSFEANNATAMTILPNGSVGIGTTSPIGLFHVNAASYPVISLSTDGGGATPAGSGRVMLGLATGVDGFATGSLSGDTVLSAKSGGSLKFGTAAAAATQSVRMTIDNLGNVGIGTTSPNSSLSFGGNAARVIKMEDSSTFSMGNSLSIQAGAGGVVGTNSDRNGGELILAGGSAIGNGTSKILFQTAGGSPSSTVLNSPVTRMTIDGSGRVGIGTTAPQAPLDITSTTSGILIPRLTTAQRTAITPIAANEGMQVYDTTTDEIWYIKGNAWVALGAAGSGVTSITVGAGLTPTGTITTTGSIAVDTGTTADKIVKLDNTAKLPAVDGSALTNLNPANLSAAVPLTKGGTGLTAGGTANQFLAMHPSSGALEYKSVTATSPLSIDYTTAGAAPITLGTVPVTKGGTALTSFAGDRLFKSNNLGTAFETFNCNDTEVLKFGTLGVPGCATLASLTAGSFVNGGNTFPGAATLGTNDAFPLNFETGGTNKMTILADGKVGIGATSPTAKLHVDAVSSEVGLRISGVNNGIELVRADGNAGSVGTIRNNGYGYINVTTNESFTGLGGESSTTKGVATSVITDVTEISPQHHFMGFFGNDTVHHSSFGDHIFKTLQPTPAQRLIIKNDGKVGIGTDAPNSTLDVNGAINQRGMTAAPAVSPASQGRIYFDTTANKFKVSENGGAYADLGAGGAASSKWTATGSNISSSNSGNVGIGTGTPGAKLHVLGQIIQSGSADITSGYMSTNSTGSVSQTALNPGLTVASLSGYHYGMDVGYSAAASRYRTRVFTNSSADFSVAKHVALVNPTLQSDFTDLFTVRGDSGNVGIGTTTWGSKLNVAGSGRFITGTSTQSSAILLATEEFDSKGAAFDVSHNTASNYSKLHFKVFAGGALFEPMTLMSSNIGINNNNPQAGLDLVSTGAGNLGLRLKGAIAQTNAMFEIQDAGSVGQISMYDNGTANFSSNVTAPAFISTSDRNLKENIRIVKGLPLILQLQGVTFDWKDDGEKDMGVIAQNVESVFPWAVVTDPKTGIKAVKYQSLIGPLIEAAKDLHKKDVEIGRSIASLESENKQLKEKNMKMERMLLDISKRLEALEGKR
ncbi:MAG TPA: tail fiber domain-containing protein [Bacteriovoracaceae bacterium]|nr:tail fiber domain-containing protein [Bacteriovoracaceae bacterium]